MSAIRVLVVDDSAFARKVMREVLSRDPAIDVVGIARDGAEALEKITELRPDVVTLDLMMPAVDGLGVLRALPSESSPKVVIVSVSRSDAELAIEALEQGAVDLVTKPTALATDRLYGLADELIVKVKTAATARPLPRAQAPLPSLAPTRTAPSGDVRLVVLGASTGGPQALTQFFSALPAGLPTPFAIALHIPAGYTAPLAARMSQASGVKIEEAQDGMRLEPGMGVIAPGGQHLRIRSLGRQFVAAVSDEPVSSLHHPSVDILFESAAREAGKDAIGVVLTGMGDDGLRGARAIRKAGGHVLAESAASCVVYGMPRAIIEEGLANAHAPLAQLPEILLASMEGRAWQ